MYPEYRPEQAPSSPVINFGWGVLRFGRRALTGI